MEVPVRQLYHKHKLNNDELLNRAWQLPLNIVKGDAALGIVDVAILCYAQNILPL